jgi:branched-chain amino acid transport system ATP-binding protein
MSMYGISSEAGGKIAVEEINAAGGILGRQVKMITRDDKLNPEVGLREAKDLLATENVDFLTGTISSAVGVAVSTTFRSIMGLTPPRSGRVALGGQDLRGKQPFEIARLGVGLVPEDRDIFPNLTVRENLEIAAKPPRKGTRGEAWTIERVRELFPVLRERDRQWGGTLSGGEQQMLTIARTLMGNPIVLLLDEPSEGLAPKITQAIHQQILALKKSGMTILLSEQNSTFALGVSDRAYILEKGHVLWRGPVSELQAKPEILKTHLGV